MDKSFTSTNESNEGSLSGIIKTALDKFQMNLQICLPCVVTKVNANKTKVNVVPLIRIIKTDGTTEKRAEIFNLNIKKTSTSEYVIHIPVNVGDFGYIRTCDRDLSLFKQTYKESKPNTLRKNDFADAVFEPDTINPDNYTIDQADIDKLVIQYKNNDSKIVMSENKITLQAETIEQRATNHVFTDGTIKHDGTSIDKTHVHLQNDGNDAGGGVNTTAPTN